jgi:predicted esterase YcpF (UPF0227 family)
MLQCYRGDEEMIIYIHGFGGSGLGLKASLFRAHFGRKILAPSLAYQPVLAIDTLTQIINSILPYKKPSLIGSSLGGFYALYLANKFELKCALINPALNPQKSLGKITRAVSYYDGSGFDWTSLHLKELEQFEVKNPNEKNCLLLLQKKDEVLDFNEAIKKLPKSKTILEEGGSHSFEGIERHFDTIWNFFNETEQKDNLC